MQRIERITPHIVNWGVFTWGLTWTPPHWCRVATGSFQAEAGGEGRLALPPHPDHVPHFPQLHFDVQTAPFSPSCIPIAFWTQSCFSIYQSKRQPFMKTAFTAYSPIFFSYDLSRPRGLLGALPAWHIGRRVSLSFRWGVIWGGDKRPWGPGKPLHTMISGSQNSEPVSPFVAWNDTGTRLQRETCMGASFGSV